MIRSAATRDRQKRLYDKLDSPWLGPYLVVSLAGWAVGVQLHPDSPVLMIHCQDLNKISHARGLVSWICTDSPACICTDSPAYAPGLGR